MAFEGLEAMAAVNNPEVMAAGVAAVGQEMHLPEELRAGRAATKRSRNG